MTKKVNKVQASEQEVSSKSETTQNVVKPQLLTGNQMLVQKFSELPFEKKREYLRIVWGTIRGTTGFFDTRFTAGMPDYKSFTLSPSETADVLIRNSGTYSDAGGGSESNNCIVIHKGDEIFSGGGDRYFESKKIDRKDLDYNEILECTFDAEKNSFLVQAKCADGSKKSIQAQKTGNYNFEEKLLGELRVPTSLLEEGKGEAQEQLMEVLDQEHQEFVKRNMYQRAVDIFILKGGRDDWKEAEKYMEKEGVLLSDDQKRLYVEHMFEGYNRGGNEDMKKILLLLKGMEDQEYIKGISEKILEKTMNWKDATDIVEEAIALGGFTQEKYQDKKLEYLVQHAFGRDDNNIEIFEKALEEYQAKTLEECLASKKLWYEKLLQKACQSDLVTGYNGDYVTKIVSKIANALGRSFDEVYKEIFIQNMEQTEINYYSLKKIFEVIESKNYEKELYNKVRDKIASSEEFLEGIGCNEKLEVIRILAEIKTAVNQRFSSSFFENVINQAARYTNSKAKEKGEIQVYQKIWEDCISDYAVAEKELILKSMANRYVKKEARYEAIDLVNWGLEDEEKIVELIEYLLDKEHYITGSDALLRKLEVKKLLEKNDLQKRINEVYTKTANIYCGGKSTGSNSYCDKTIEEYAKHADKNIVQEYVSNKINEFVTERKGGRDYDFYFTHVTNCLTNAGFDSISIQNIIVQYIKDDKCDIAAKFIKGLGLKVDKIRVNAIVQDTFKAGKFEGAEVIAKNGGIYDIWKKKLAIKKLENKMMGSYDAKRAIEECGIDPSYYSYLIDAAMASGNIKEAMELAEKNNLFISEEQFQRYMGRNERLKKADDERKAREKKEREAKAVEMMKVVLEGKISCDVVYTQNQKYVLIWNPETGLQIASHNLERHRDIVAHVKEDKKNVVGGGSIVIDEATKILKLYGKSGDFGKVAEEYNQVLLNIIKVQYPEYSIQIQ